MKFIISSIFLHIIIFLSTYTFNFKKNYSVEKIGNSSNPIDIAMNFSPKEIIEEVGDIQEVEETVETPVINPKQEIQKKEGQKKERKKDPVIKKTTSNSHSTTSSEINSDLIELSKGIFAAKNQGVKGLKYSFISQPDPEYPVAAKKLGITKEISIKVRILVNSDGNIEEIKFYNKNDNLGFQEEVSKALKHWKLTPVTLNNQPIKLYFYKEFKFNQK